MFALRLCSAQKALQAAARDASTQVSHAVRPLSAVLIESLMGDDMSRPLAVAVDRPAYPCQVLRAGQAVGASGTQPGDVCVEAMMLASNRPGGCVSVLRCWADMGWSGVLCVVWAAQVAGG